MLPADGEQPPPLKLNVPMWRHGLLPLPFIYGLEDGDKPYLKYVPATWTGAYYSFRNGTWDSTAQYLEGRPAQLCHQKGGVPRISGVRAHLAVKG